jgi:hypothetical protein
MKLKTNILFQTTDAEKLIQKFKGECKTNLETIDRTIPIIKLILTE